MILTPPKGTNDGLRTKAKVILGSKGLLTFKSFLLYMGPITFYHEKYELRNEENIHEFLFDDRMNIQL
jgi:hypothetical protein